MGYKYIGDSNQLNFQFESGTYAVASGTRQWIGLVQDHSATEGAGVEPIRFQGNFSRNIGLFTNGKLEYEGTFTYYPQDWKFLAFAIGSAQVLTGSVLIRESDSDDANYAVPAQSLSSFTLEDAKKTAATGSNFIRTFKGCMIDSLKLTMAEGEIASCEVGYKAQNVVYSSGTVTTVTARTTKPYMWSDINVQLPSGTKLTNATEFSLTINNNLESRFPLNGSRTIETVIPLNRDYEVAATFLMDSDNASTLYNTYYIQGNAFNSMVEIKATAGSAYIIMSGCRITDMSVPSPVEGLTEQTCTIMPTNVYVNVYDAIGSYNAW
jgi:hypothetical protein